jgi:hypothetical protein
MRRGLQSCNDGCGDLAAEWLRVGDGRQKPLISLRALPGIGGFQRALPLLSERRACQRLFHH